MGLIKRYLAIAIPKTRSSDTTLTGDPILANVAAMSEMEYYFKGLGIGVTLGTWDILIAYVKAEEYSTINPDHVKVLHRIRTLQEADFLFNPPALNFWGDVLNYIKELQHMC